MPPDIVLDFVYGITALKKWSHPTYTEFMLHAVHDSYYEGSNSQQQQQARVFTEGERCDMRERKLKKREGLPVGEGAHDMWDLMMAISEVTLMAPRRRGKREMIEKWRQEAHGGEDGAP
jgi:hypothetical protein